MASEKSLQAGTKRRVKALRGWLMTTSQPGPKSYGIRGVSDVLICISGAFGVIEHKNPNLKKAEPTPSQRHFMDQVEAAGGMALCSNDREEIDRWLDQLAERGRRIAAGTTEAEEKPDGT